MGNRRRTVLPHLLTGPNPHLPLPADDSLGGAAGTGPGAPAAPGANPEATGGTPAARDGLDDFARVAAELGLTPGQIAGRLEASKKWESRSKEREDYDTIKQELEQLRQASMTDAERARTEAFEGGRAAERTEVAPKLVAAHFRAEAALAGRDVAAVDSFLEDLNVAKFVTATGDVDVDRVRERVKALPAAAGGQQQSPGAGTGAPRHGDPGQGGSNPPPVSPGAAGIAAAQRRFGSPTAQA